VQRARGAGEATAAKIGNFGGKLETSDIFRFLLWRFSWATHGCARWQVVL
jgi:hypothetical protein